MIDAGSIVHHRRDKKMDVISHIDRIADDAQAVATTTDSTTTATASTGTGSAQHAVDSAQLAKVTQKATTAYRSARENAAISAASVYYVWFHAQSQHASEANKEWLANGIAAQTKVIEATNDKIMQQIKGLEKQCKLAVKQLKTKQKEANDPDVIADCKRQIETLQNDHNRERRELTAERMVKLETRSDAAEHTQITRFVLELYRPNQASHVNRFATAVKWIATSSKWSKQPDIDAIAKEILEAGGIEAVQEIQDGIDEKKVAAATTGGAGETKTDASNPTDADAQDFLNTVKEAASLQDVQLKTGYAADSLVTLIGRVGSNGISILSHHALDAGEALTLCVRHPENTLLPTNAGIEFVATALSIGELVDESKSAGQHAETDAVTRELSAIADDKGVKLVISAMNSKVSVVVHAEPRDSAAKALLSQPGHWKMLAEHRKALTAIVSDPFKRKQRNIEMSNTASKVGDNLLHSPWAWNCVLARCSKAEDNSVSSSYPWLGMSPYETTPLNIDRFQASCVVTVTHDELVKLINGKIGNWLDPKTKKTDGKKAAVATLTIAKSQIKVASTQGEDLVDCQVIAKGPVELKFRPQMLAKVLNKVAEFGATSYRFEPDINGALLVSFEDRHGCYSIYLPSCNDDAQLESWLFKKIRVPDNAED
jgi:hypothetical protein